MHKMHKRCYATTPLRGLMTSPVELLLVLPLPASRNAEPRYWAEVMRLRRHWSDLAVIAWADAGSPTASYISIHPTFVTKRKIDIDNLIGSNAVKGVLDGLKGRLVPDDNPDYLSIGRPIVMHGTSQRMELLISLTGDTTT